jgi:putative addiction module CopG family antidote
MTVILTPELTAIVESRVATGQYGSPLDVLREALHLLERSNEFIPEDQHRIACEVEKGWESAEKEDDLDGYEFFAELEREEAVRFGTRSL